MRLWARHLGPLLPSDPRRERLRLLATSSRAATMARHRGHPAVPT